MEAQVLLDKIAVDRVAKVTAIEAEASAQVSVVETETKAEVDRINAAAAIEAEKAAAQVGRAILAQARLAAKLHVQKARRAAFDDVMNSAKVVAVGDDAAKARVWDDRQPVLELALGKQLAS